MNDYLCDLIWKKYNENPSAHLYVLWIAYKECINLDSLYLNFEEAANIRSEIFWKIYDVSKQEYMHYNKIISDIIKND